MYIRGADVRRNEWYWKDREKNKNYENTLKKESQLVRICHVKLTYWNLIDGDFKERRRKVRWRMIIIYDIKEGRSYERKKGCME